ncbi:armadillo-type protein [Papiliotrema laurentii]|uniref:Nucleolar protein 9 n=1 Tax=Papiliotrema laurentii TaxID=5418 RepID=A0AAD9FVA2_PAPLA|nr:armadillo-type protein [Papiliotrema laurentii]
MPKEQIRKRGKRKGKNQDDNPSSAPAPVVNNFTEQQVEDVPEPQAGPSTGGIHPARAALLAGRRPVPSDIPAPEPVEDQQVLEWSRAQVQDAEFPFGVLDPDLKAYFRTVDDQIRDWEGVSSAGEEREDRQIFLSSVLSELRGHELTVSTDPDTAVVLERLLPSLGDWGRRVIGDAFGDSWEVLVRHRFGSHVVQTWFTLAADTLDREAKGVFPPQHHEQEKSAETMGTLPTMTALFAKLVGLIQPSISGLLTNPHASPPIRLLLIILTPPRSVPTLDAAEDAKGGLIRSKKSGKYRKGQAVQGKSIFGDEEETGKGKGKARRVPEELVELRKQVTEKLVGMISPVEWQSMGLHAVGSAAVQLLLDLEVEDGKAKQSGSLLDILTEGLVGRLAESSGEELKAQTYPSSLLTTATGSRLFESILAVAPEEVFKSLWTVYFVGKTGKFAGHPFANFVTAKGVSRLDAEDVEQVVKECRAVAGGRSLISGFRSSFTISIGS